MQLSRFIFGQSDVIYCGKNNVLVHTATHILPNHKMLLFVTLGSFSAYVLLFLDFVGEGWSADRYSELSSEDRSLG